MASQFPTQSSRLNSGQPPPSYNSVDPRNGTPHDPRSTPRGPSPTQPLGTLSNLGNGSIQRPSQVVMSRGLVICLAIILVQAVLIICHSDALAILIDLESAATRASTAKSALVAEKSALVEEKSALVVEREKLGRERERMKQDREMWERAREDRVPRGAFWDLISPALDCRAYGKREYWAALRNIPEGWSATDACMNTPAKVKGVTVRRPYRCAFVDESSEIRGYWMVDWDEPGCHPYYRNCREVGCTSYKSGKRRIEGELVGINHEEIQNWWPLCNTTPLTWDLITYASPTHCEERNGRKIGIWDIPDDGCLDR